MKQAPTQAQSPTQAQILFPDQAQPSQLGGKGAALQALSDGFPVPDWFAVVAPPELEADTGEVAGLAEALRALDGGDGCYAVRSSAADEDGSAHSFAGQLESYLEVPAGEVLDRVRDVWRSARSERVLAYRRNRGLDGAGPLPTVLVQRMVPAEWAGVAFSADPVSGRRGVRVVAAVAGLGEALVSGETSGETLHFDRDGQRLDEEQVRVPVTIAQSAAQLAADTEVHFQCPRDIEWAWADGRLWLLQSRPVTTLRELPDPDGAPILWDNSNIAESYSGVTTPMTFSFARYVYAGVYREFCRLLRVPEPVIAANHTVFEQLLGLIRGRIYYNLLNWYRCLAMLPGFSVNRSLMEQMMGVGEAMPEEFLPLVVPPRASFWARMRDGLRLLGSVIALTRSLRRLPRDIRAFYQRLDAALGSAQRDFSGMRADELVAHYQQLEERLLSRWDAPLVNDFFAMIFHGVLGRLCQRWVGEEGRDLHNALLVAESGIISTEPARRVAALAQQMTAHPELVALMRSGDERQIRQALGQHDQLLAQVQAYLAEFGDRCVEELKLESRTLNEDPLPLYRALGARAATSAQSASRTGEDPAAVRQRAEARMAQALRGRPLRHWLFRRVLNQARARVRERENLRFERTRLFGRVRRIVHELGKRLYAADCLDQPDQVFYLELQELLGFVQGYATTTDLRALVRVRQAEYAGWEQGPAPANRFVTRGAVNTGHDFRSEEVEPVLSAEGDLKGTGCCSGVVRGRARVVTDPRGVSLEPGDILVAERTDPGWILLLSAAAGVVVEHGSLLSHAAIVSRELGLPSVVAVPGVTRLLRDGETLEIDGASGVIRRLDNSNNDDDSDEP